MPVQEKSGNVFNAPRIRQQKPKILDVDFLGPSHSKNWRNTPVASLYNTP